MNQNIRDQHFLTLKFVQNFLAIHFCQCLKWKYAFVLLTAYRRHTLTNAHNKMALSSDGTYALSTKHTHAALLSCVLLARSLFLRASPSGAGHRGRHHRCGLPPHHHCVLQAVQDKETEAAGGERGGSPQREKRPHCVVRPRERQRERRRGIEGGAEESHASSLARRLTLGTRACGAPSWVLGLFSCWTLHFRLPLQPQSLDPKSGAVDGQLSLTRDKLRMYLCVESCRYRT